MLRRIRSELVSHAPFTAFGAVLGIGVALAFVWGRAPRALSEGLFWTLHPAHVLLSALVTSAIYRRHGRGGLLVTVAVGYLGSVGIASLSDCVIPFLGERLLGLAATGIHLGFVERPWIVNGLALGGIAIAWFFPRTRLAHSGHVLLSTGASLFHMMMALGDVVPLGTLALIPVFLFLAVWLPCCLSDIVFPLLFAPARSEPRGCTGDPAVSRARREEA